MRGAVSWLAAGVAIVVAFGYALQGGDSAGRPAPKALAVSVRLAPILVNQGELGTTDYFLSREAIVPVGATTIDLPILMYHYIRNPPSPVTDYLGYKLSVAPQTFQAQMSRLGASGYHPVNFDDVRAYFDGTQPLPAKPVIISLDDGYSDLYTNAYPILLAYGFKAVAYIVTSYVGWPGYVTRDEILEMDRNHIEIASHTVDHPNLARSSIGSVTYELRASKRWLESLLGHPVLDFAYPSGKFNPQVVAALQTEGYDTAVTVDYSVAHTRLDRYAWGRVRVGGGESMEDFMASLGPFMLPTLVTEVDIREVTPIASIQVLRGL